MTDYQSIMSEVIKLFNTSFTVFGYNLTISGVLIGCFIISLVCFAIRKMFY